LIAQARKHAGKVAACFRPGACKIPSPLARPNYTKLMSICTRHQAEHDGVCV